MVRFISLAVVGLVLGGCIPPVVVVNVGEGDVTATPTVIPTPTPEPGFTCESEVEGFHPLDLGPVLFLCADTGVVPGDGGVSTWEDQSGEGNDFSQSTQGKRPALTASYFGDRPAIVFDGSDDVLGATDFLTGGAGLVAALVRLEAEPDARQVVLGSGREINDTSYIAVVARVVDTQGNKNQVISRNNAGTTNQLNGETAITDEADYIMVWGSSGSTTFIRLNGVGETIAVESGSNSGEWFGDVIQRANVTVGALKRSAEVFHFAGGVGLIVVVDEAVAGSDQELLEQWMDAWAGGGILGVEEEFGGGDEFSWDGGDGATESEDM